MPAPVLRTSITTALTAARPIVWIAQPGASATSGQRLRFGQFRRGFDQVCPAVQIQETQHRQQANETGRIP
jgi:hypothetical protein